MKIRKVFLLPAIIFCTWLIQCEGYAQAITEPGGTPEDVAMAINNPYEYAWHLFFYLNHQAKSGIAGEADPAKATIKNYDDDTAVVWETWAAATGGLALLPGETNTSEVFLSKGIKPQDWSTLPRSGTRNKVLDRTFTTLESQLREKVLPQNISSLNGMGGLNPLFIPPNALGKDDEIRLNRATFDHIRDNHLYSVEGMQAAVHNAFNSGNRDVITFPIQSKEIKARWIPIKEADKPRYHWRSIKVTNSNGNIETQVWGLSGLHIITKDLPNWFWTDFEHVDQEQDGIKEGRPSVDPTTRVFNGQKPVSGNDGVRNELVGSKWANYRLRGIQVDFTDKFGKSTLLANTLIEPIDNGPSSCMTCHSKATASLGIRQGAQPPFVITTLPVQFIAGVPSPDQFLGADGKVKFIQTDFLWSMPFRAHSEHE